MNEIDLRKILKDCPKDWKFYSTIFGEETHVLHVNDYEGNPCPITIYYGKIGESVKRQISRYGHPFADGCGECCLFPSREMRDWSKFEAPWYKKERFDPHTLQPFDKILVRQSIFDYWLCDHFSFMKDDAACRFWCSSNYWCYCIPYNDDTKHLVGTNDEAPEYYRYWEK